MIGDGAINPSAYFNSSSKPIICAVVASNCLIFGLMLLLAFAKDLGKVRTNFIGILCMVLTLATICAMFFANIEIANEIKFMSYTRLATRALLVIIAHVMAQFKYIDKAERGAK